MKPPQKTQRQCVLEMLQSAGDKGVHSFTFIQARIPRVAARVCELREEGHRIESTREALHGAAEGVRYTLNAGVGAEGSNACAGCLSPPSEARMDRELSTDSGVEASVLSPPPPLGDGTGAPPACSAYDCWVEDEAA